MYKIYLKQAWKMLKEDKVISIISILGTALAITIVMVMILTKEMKTANIAPEVNKTRTMYINYSKETQKNRNNVIGNPVSGKLYKQYLSQLETPESISLQSRRVDRIYSVKNNEDIEANIMSTDPVFWNIYKFSFLEGKPFSEEDFQSGIPSAVISNSTAKKLFGKESPIGKEFSYNDKQYRVCGKVKDVSFLSNNAYAQIWVPHTSTGKLEDKRYMVTILAKNTGDFSKIKEEIRESEVRNNTEVDEYTVEFIGPYSNEELLIKGEKFSTKDPDMKKDKIKFYLTLSILLLIPAINLSGFSLFKIISRTSEIGIRKAFGAKKKTILMQILYENLLTSIIGGIIGLLLSYSVVALIKDRLFSSDLYKQTIGESTIPISAFISPSIFFYVFLVCLILNILSSGIPAWRASRLNIADSIKQ